MRRFAADLHIHTSLSPCAEASMTPDRIVAVASSRGLDMIAICDHNSAGAVEATREAAAGCPALTVLPGIEITTREEVHVLGLFPDAAAALAVGAAVQATLPRELPVSTASTFPLTEAVALVHAHGGLAVAAHIDRRAFSVLGQLGLLPEEPRFDAAEISAEGVARGRVEQYRTLGLPLISGSDSHRLEDIATGGTMLDLQGPSFSELALALRSAGGRRCSLA